MFPQPSIAIDCVCGRTDGGEETRRRGEVTVIASIEERTQLETLENEMSHRVDRGEDTRWHRCVYHRKDRGENQA